MATLETPDIRHSTYSASAMQASAMQANQATGGSAGMDYLSGNSAGMDYLSVVKRINQEKKGMATIARRLVQVFIVDPYESVPLKDCLLYKGELKLTDLTDQELFYEIDIKQLLDAHNEKRIKIVDKKVKERIEHLEPARIRDLRMQIVTVATF